MTATKEEFFKPAKLAAEQAGSIAKQITAAEVAAREKKTQELRALRLAQAQAHSLKKHVK
ncbi:hypothetical protein [Rhizobium sp. BK251]|uniref:hypothetical protein n=1 Tax=Rhizobium sp. BK251 TaxID=2512125 RepID=UPI00104C072F|nr:hypothetical protein [Rhizobium sp. BK251]TCL64621.1 hypothetical protein EV286_11442 [Rhizobium sp. BK251]